MADRVNVQCYSEMIDALNVAAGNIDEVARDLYALATTCASILGDSDTGAAKMIEKTTNTVGELEDCKDDAVAIASAMQEELDAQLEENSVWDDDSDE